MDPRASLASWLRNGRAQRKLSLDDVARITKIQARILEKLEAGDQDGLPAEVFVRGFVRSFARCVGLDETEAIERYAATSKDAAPAVKAFVETMVPPTTSSVRVIEPVAVAETAAEVEAAVPTPPRKKKHRGARRKNARKKTAEPIAAAPTPAAPTPAAPTPDPEPEPVAVAEPVAVSDPAPEAPVEPLAEGSGPHQTWQPTMPPLPAAPSPPWRRPAFTPPVPTTPSLVIDDSDPERAEREQADREAKEPARVSFLPPILLDRDDRSARQGGLTLAVIILLIAATLTLSYLMRRPTVTGDGVTMADVPSLTIS